MSTPDSPDTDWVAAIQAHLDVLIVVGLACLAGWLAGGLLRLILRRRPGAPWGLPVLLLLPVAGAAAIPPFAMGIGFWDWLTLGTLFGIGLAAGSHDSFRRIQRASVVLGVAVTMVCLALAEVICRQLPAPAFRFPDASAVHLSVEGHGGILTDGESQVRPLYPEVFPEAADERLGTVARQAPAVFHVGDSMVHGTSIGFDGAFPALLMQQQPDLHHVNLGVPGTGTDFQVLLVENWVQRLRPQHVVLYLFPANDLFDIGRAYPFCDNGPIFAFESADLEPLCPQPVWVGPSHSRLLESPPPYPVRVLASWSALARQLCGMTWAVSSWLKQNREVETQLGQLTRLISALATSLDHRDIRFTVVLLPYRARFQRLIDGEPPDDDYHMQVLKALEQLPVRLLDAGPLFENAVLADGSTESWFLNKVPDDVHFSAKGHRLLARWLTEQL